MSASVSPAWRDIGKIVLWTQSILLAAHRIDENAGLPSRKRKSRTPAAERI
jgi:hypothetical protein